MAASATDHVIDSPVIEIFPTAGWEIHLPKIFGFQITKFMVIELIVAILMLAIFIPLAKRVRNGQPVTGWFWNAFESILTYIRDNVAKPYIGEHDADKFVPYLWTVFIFVLFNNLFGTIPWMGSPTSDLSVTGALALCSFVVIFFVPMIYHGPVHFFKSFIPHAEMHGPILIIGFPVLLMVAAIEILGLGIKSAVLAIRLFANIFAGHTVLAAMLMFIPLVKNSGFLTFWGVSLVTVTFLVALSLLEMFVAFLQAFVFTFLTALFLGVTLHPEH